MALILDTNALSALADGDRVLARTIGRGELALPIVALGEYLFGIRASRHRIRLEEWLDVNLPDYQLLLAGLATADHYAEIRRELKNSGRPIPSNDLWIAASAREHNMPIVTRDRHFGAIRGLQVVSW